MTTIFDFFQEHKINTQKQLEHFFWTSHPKKILAFIQKIQSLIAQDNMNREYSPFSFIPSADLSGVEGCCAISCKLNRASHFALFASLYADTVYLNLTHLNSCSIDETIFLEDSHENYDVLYQIWCDLALILFYKDLIECKIIRLVTFKDDICPSCMKKRIEHLKIPKIISSMKTKYIETAHLTINSYDKKSSIISILINGMNDFFPEHEITTEFNLYELPSLSINKFKKGTIIKSKECRKFIVTNVIEQALRENYFSTLNAVSFSSKIITSTPVDLLFGELLSNSDKNSAPNAIENIPFYDLPIVDKIPIKSIINLRGLEQDAFNNYRIALKSALQNRNFEKNFYDDIIYPSLTKLESKINSAKNGFYKKTLGSLIIVPSIIGAALYTGLISKDLLGLVSAVGGIPAITNLGVSSWNEYVNKNKEIKENDFYFLWKLKKLTRK